MKKKVEFKFSECDLVTPDELSEFRSELFNAFWHGIEFKPRCTDADVNLETTGDENLPFAEWFSKYYQNPPNKVFNRTPSSTSFINRGLAFVGSWLIKLSERAG